jgi:hypothetical protein
MSSIARHVGRNLVAYTALLLALTGTSIAAANYIDGSQIRPHSIPKNRLTPGAIASLRAVAGVTSVSSVYGRPVQQCAANGGACSTGVAYARCPKFSYVVGGGYRSTNARQRRDVGRHSGPDDVLGSRRERGALGRHHQGTGDLPVRARAGPDFSLKERFTRF